jgi:hypothetical protein
MPEVSTSYMCTHEEIVDEHDDNPGRAGGTGSPLA